jgi:hypothetical protein
MVEEGQLLERACKRIRKWQLSNYREEAEKGE